MGSVELPNLSDFNWEVKMALSSDSVAIVNEPLVNLQLTLSNQNKSTDNPHEERKEETKVLELSKDELDLLIESLTQASEAIVTYTS